MVRPAWAHTCGCKSYCELDEGLSHRLRAVQLKHSKRPRAIYRELKARGEKEHVATQVAGYSRRWWCNSDRLLKTVLNIAYYDGLDVPRLSSPQTLEPHGADPHTGWCGRGAAMIAPLCRSVVRPAVLELCFSAPPASGKPGVFRETRLPAAAGSWFDAWPACGLRPRFWICKTSGSCVASAAIRR